MILLFTLVVFSAGLICIGGFLWSVVEERPRAIWLVGAAVAVLVGIAGLAVHVH